MGQLRGIIQLTGTFGGLSFYKTRTGVIRVRATGGFDGDAIKTKPNYVRTRENAQEFTEVVAVGAFLRRALQAYLRPMRIPYGHNRVVQLFHQVQKMDLISTRGSRKVLQGLQTEEGRALLQGFEFDVQHTIAGYFGVNYTFFPELGQLKLDSFSSKQVYFPKGATRARFLFVLFRMDFELQCVSAVTETSLGFTKEEYLPATVLTVTVPQGTGILIGLIGIQYDQEVSGVFYPLQERGLRMIL